MALCSQRGAGGRRRRNRTHLASQVLSRDAPASNARRTTLEDEVARF